MAGRQPQTTLVPFSTLPACATDCGPLYDANGACVPPNVPRADEQTYDNCFCAYGELQAWATGLTAVCDNACVGSPTDMASIRGWFSTLCSNQIAFQTLPPVGAAVSTVIVTQTPTDAATLPTTSSASNFGSGGAAAGSSSNSSGGDWLSTHWKWVIMIVVLVVGIAAIWIGACVWRRHHQRKKDRMGGAHKRSSGNLEASWGPGAANGPGGTNPYAYGDGVRDAPNAAGAAAGRSRSTSNRLSRADGKTAQGAFMPGPTMVHGSGPYDEKDARVKEKEKRRWIVKERT